MESNIRNSIEGILKDNICAVLATVSEGGCHSNTIYYCYDDDLNIYFSSDCNTEHCRNIINNANISLSIYNSPLSYGAKHQGLQIEGVCQLISGVELMKGWKLYTKRFPIFKLKIGDITNISKKILTIRLYKIVPSRIKVTDSERYGNEIIEVYL